MYLPISVCNGRMSRGHKNNCTGQKYIQPRILSLPVASAISEEKQQEQFQGKSLLSVTLILAVPAAAIYALKTCCQFTAPSALLQFLKQFLCRQAY